MKTELKGSPRYEAAPPAARVESVAGRTGSVERAVSLHSVAVSSAGYRPADSELERLGYRMYGAERSIQAPVLPVLTTRPGNIPNIPIYKLVAGGAGETGVPAGGGGGGGAPAALQIISYTTKDVRNLSKSDAFINPFRDDVFLKCCILLHKKYFINFMGVLPSAAQKKTSTCLYRSCAALACFPDTLD